MNAILFLSVLSWFESSLLWWLSWGCFPHVCLCCCFIWWCRLSHVCLCGCLCCGFICCRCLFSCCYHHHHNPHYHHHTRKSQFWTAQNQKVVTNILKSPLSRPPTKGICSFAFHEYCIDQKSPFITITKQLGCRDRQTGRRTLLL